MKSRDGRGDAAGQQRPRRRGIKQAVVRRLLPNPTAADQAKIDGGSKRPPPKVEAQSRAAAMDRSRWRIPDAGMLRPVSGVDNGVSGNNAPRVGRRPKSGMTGSARRLDRGSHRILETTRQRALRLVARDRPAARAPTAMPRGG